MCDLFANYFIDSTGTTCPKCATPQPAGVLLSSSCGVYVACTAGYALCSGKCLKVDPMCADSLAT